MTQTKHKNNFSNKFIVGLDQSKGKIATRSSDNKQKNNQPKVNIQLNTISKSNFGQYEDSSEAEQTAKTFKILPKKQEIDSEEAEKIRKEHEHDVHLIKKLENIKNPIKRIPIVSIPKKQSGQYVIPPRTTKFMSRQEAESRNNLEFALNNFIEGAEFQPSFVYHRSTDSIIADVEPIKNKSLSKIGSRSGLRVGRSFSSISMKTRKGFHVLVKAKPKQPIVKIETPKLLKKTMKETPQNVSKITKKRKVSSTPKKMSDAKKPKIMLKPRIRSPEPIAEVESSHVNYNDMELVTGVFYKANETKGTTIQEFYETIGIKDYEFTDLPKLPVKVSEASFSEVFEVDFEEENPFGIKPSARKTIVKVIPLTEHYSEGAFARECFILKELQDIDGVCKAKGFCILNGEYSPEYLDAWKRYKGTCENENPKKYSENQKYGCIFMENGGSDLEAHHFLGANEVIYFIRKLLSIILILQNTKQFEHRDMHWGNILVGRKSPETSQNPSFIELKQLLKNTTGESTYEPLTISLIDFSYSRVENDKMVVFTDLNAKNLQWIFEGDAKRDNQFEVYRQMKEVTDDWIKFTPRTNLLWFGYILEKLLKKISFFGDSELNKFINELVEDIDVGRLGEDLMLKIEDFSTKRASLNRSNK